MFILKLVGIHCFKKNYATVQVSLPEGGLQCWVVLSGLEVLAACQKHETGQVDKCSIFTAHLWDHIRNKVTPGSWVLTSC